MKTKHVWEKQNLIIFIIACLAFAVSLAYIGYRLYGYVQQKNLENRQQELVSALPPVPSYTPPPAGSSTAPANNGGITSPPDDPESPVPAPAENDPDATAPQRPDYKSRFQTILDINEDFFGVLSIPGLGAGVDKSFVVQGSNNDYYLNMSFDKKNNAHGTLFLDFQAPSWFEGKNYVIYGHNMGDGTMFHDLLKYNKVGTYLSAPVIEFDTIYGPTTWLIFAAYTCEYDFNYYHTYFSDRDFADLLEEIQLRSGFHTGVEVLPTDTLLTLSTCNYDFQEARFTVQARLLRDGETLDGFTASAEVNSNPKSPNIPKQMRLSEMPANNSAYTQHAGLRRDYYFRTDESGVLWYTGSTASSVQGPYRAWSGRINSEYYSWLATCLSRKDDKNNFYIVSGGLGGSAPGLFVLYRDSIPNGPFALLSQTPITPSGVDARWPALYVDETQEVTVFYTSGEGAETAIYSIPIGGGKPKEVYRSSAALDPRPSCVIETGANGPALLVQEFATGVIRAVYLDGGETVTVDISASAGRFFVHKDVRSGSLRYIYEKNGSISTGSFDVASIPPKPAQPEATPSDITSPDDVPPDNESPDSDNNDS